MAKKVYEVRREMEDFTPPTLCDKPMPLDLLSMMNSAELKLLLIHLRLKHETQFQHSISEETCSQLAIHLVHRWCVEFTSHRLGSMDTDVVKSLRLNQQP